MKPEGNCASDEPVDVLAGFTEVVLACASTPDFLTEFNRLAGCQLGQPRSVLDTMIDESTGWEKEQLRRFTGFVWEFVFVPLMVDAA